MVNKYVIIYIQTSFSHKNNHRYPNLCYSLKVEDLGMIYRQLETGIS